MTRLRETTEKTAADFLLIDTNYGGKAVVVAREKLLEMVGKPPRVSAESKTMTAIWHYDQCKARIHRVGQHHPCTYVHLVARRTVDEKVLRALRDKSNIAKPLVDDYGRTSPVSGSTVSYSCRGSISGPGFEGI